MEGSLTELEIREGSRQPQLEKFVDEAPETDSNQKTNLKSGGDSAPLLDVKKLKGPPTTCWPRRRACPATGPSLLDERHPVTWKCTLGDLDCAFVTHSNLEDLVCQAQF